MKTQEKNKQKRSKSGYKKSWNGVPATVKPTLFEASLYESVFASLFWHIMGTLLIWLIVFMFMFFGIIPKLFSPPKPKMNDIAFIIKNSPGHRLHYHKTTAPKSTVDADVNIATPEAPSSSAKNQNTKSQNNTKSNNSDFSIPMPNLKSMSSGLDNSGKTSHHAAGFDPSSARNLNSSSSEGSSSSGHSGFDKNTTRKIITTYDISPYVNELKRNIRWNWKAPKESGNKRVDLFLRIAKDGKVIILNVKKTSEIGEVDNAALSAVRKSIPLNPLPAKYTKGYLDVIFMFDSNTISSKF